MTLAATLSNRSVWIDNDGTRGGVNSAATQYSSRDEHSKEGFHVLNLIGKYGGWGVEMMIKRAIPNFQLMRLNQ